MIEIVFDMVCEVFSTWNTKWKKNVFNVKKYFGYPYLHVVTKYDGFKW